MSCDYRRPECNCGSRAPATCVDYEGTVGECSTLDTTQPLNAQDVIEDLYKMVCELKSATDLTDVSADCITHDGTLKDLAQKLLTKVCELANSVSSIPDFGNCQLNYGNLADPCGQTINITTQCEFNQLMLDILNQIKNNA